MTSESKTEAIRRALCGTEGAVEFRAGLADAKRAGGEYRRGVSCLGSGGNPRQAAEPRRGRRNPGIWSWRSVNWFSIPGQSLRLQAGTGLRGDRAQDRPGGRDPYRFADRARNGAGPDRTDSPGSAGGGGGVPSSDRRGSCGILRGASYAVAAVASDRLLYVGEDFTDTDLEAA